MTMTKMQVTKKISQIKGVSISGRGENWQVETEDEVQTRSVFKLLRAEGVICGGFRCGHGGWVIRPGYKADDIPFDSKASPHHY